MDSTAVSKHTVLYLRRILELKDRMHIIKPEPSASKKRVMGLDPEKIIRNSLWRVTPYSGIRVNLAGISGPMTSVVDYPHMRVKDWLPVHPKQKYLQK